jgi:hypothetical protein
MFWNDYAQYHSTGTATLTAQGDIYPSRQVFTVTLFQGRVMCIVGSPPVPRLTAENVVR